MCFQKFKGKILPYYPVDKTKTLFSTILLSAKTLLVIMHVSFLPGENAAIAIHTRTEQKRILS